RPVTVHLLGGTAEFVQFIEEQPFVSAIATDDTRSLVSFLYRGTDDQQRELLRTAILKDIQIITFTQAETDKEDVFMEITKGVETK
ncbi:hypothetical protein Q2337_26845, partial [Escherichia coli]|nr:hypothetical protein [Escherichia coli]